MGRVAEEGAGRPERHHDDHDLGPRLQPALLDACDHRLSNVRWFRSDWQIGGAATGFASFAPGAAPPRDVMIKLPVASREYAVLTALADADAPTPRVVFHGRSLAGEPHPWVVMERLPGTPAAAHLHADVIPHLIEAAAAFQKVCPAHLSLDPPHEHDWARLLDRSRDALRANDSIPEHARWAAAVKHTQKALPRLLDLWNARDRSHSCHGDLHPGNCMERPADSPWGPPGHILFDFAEAHRGHWVEDAVYLERLYWARPRTLAGLKPVTMLAHARRRLGLDADGDYQTIADARRALIASTTPAFLDTEGHPAYLHAALDALERALVHLRL